LAAEGELGIDPVKAKNNDQNAKHEIGAFAPSERGSRAVPNKRKYHDLRRQSKRFRRHLAVPVLGGLPACASPHRSLD
jgi:hypothetical protein